MAGASTTFIASLLQRTGLFSEEQIRKVVEMARAGGTPLAEVVVQQGVAREDAFLESLGKLLRLPFVRLGDLAIVPEVLGKLPTKAVFQCNVIPIAFANGTLTVATNNPLDPGLMDTLRLASKARVKLALSPSEDISKASKKFYGGSHDPGRPG